MAQNSSPQKDIDALSAQISTLKEDIAGISQTLADLGHSSSAAATESAKQKAAGLRDAGREQYANAQHYAEDMGRQAEDAVRTQPAMAMGVAVGLGFLLGFMTGRK